MWRTLVYFALYLMCILSEKFKYDYYKAVYYTAVILYPKYEHMHIHSHNAAYSQLQSINDNSCINPSVSENISQ